MKYIEKKQPSRIEKAIKLFKQKQARIKKKPHYADFSNEDGRADLHTALLEEQGYICAYCMQRIDDTGKIEHWDGQSHNANASLNYNNMLAVCRGKLSTQKEDFHCDTMRSIWQKEKKGDLSIHPAIESDVKSIKYLKNGTIYHQNPQIATEIDQTKLSPIDIELQYYLNLNHLWLSQNRAEVYDSVRKIVEILQKNGKSQAYIQAQKTKLLDYWQTKQADGFKPFCGIVLYFLDK